MTKIKYRAWDKQKKKFLPLGEENGFDLNLSILSTGQIFWFDPSNKENPYEDVTDKFIIQLYVGLDDKNEKEIYDGDIIKHKNYKFLLKICWNNSSCSFKLISKDGGESNLSNTLSKMLEIIGNIYENPELLEKINADSTNND